MTLCPLMSDECLWKRWLQLAIMLREIHWKQTFSLSWGALGLHALDCSASLPYFRLEERTELLHFLCFSSQYVVLVMQTNTSWLWTLDSRTYLVSSYILSIHPSKHTSPSFWKLPKQHSTVTLEFLAFRCIVLVTSLSKLKKRSKLTDVWKCGKSESGGLGRERHTQTWWGQSRMQRKEKWNKKHRKAAN